LELNLIHTYTRAQMIKNGELMDVTKMAKEAGFKVPVGITRTVWEAYIKPTSDDLKIGQDVNGRLWDTLWMLFLKIRSSRDCYEVRFKVFYVINKFGCTKELKAVIGQGDRGEPVLTIMLPNED